MAWGLFGSIKKGLAKTRSRLGGALSSILTIGRKVDEEFLEELEDALISADVGPRPAMELVEEVRARFKAKEVESPDEIVTFLRQRLVERLTERDLTLHRAESGPTVYLMVGVNGTGKTTTAAKLAKHFQQEGAKVLLAAGDTFRAAAGEQLEIWSERLSVELVRHPHGSDPAAVVFDACDAALARGIDYLIVDTAGRLHTKENLMRELEKIRRVAEKKIPGSPHEALLVLDATTGQNAMSQAQLFAKGVGLSGIVLSKLDGTAKGGIAIAINREVELPIKLIGTGEKADDLAPFDPETFVSALFAGLATTEELEAEEEAAAAEVQPQEEVVPESGEGELEEDAEAGEVVEPAEETEVPAEPTAEPAGGESAEDEEPANEPEPEPEKPKKKRGWLW